MNKPSDILGRFIYATNRHDIDGMLSCFAEDYRAEYPAHPSRDFRGREQVRRIHDQLFASVPDLTVVSLRSAVDGDVLWTELEWRGTRRDDSRFLMVVRSCSVSVMMCSPGFVAISSQWTRRQSPRRSAEAECHGTAKRLLASAWAATFGTRVAGTR